jgi:hypothetical protein
MQGSRHQCQHVRTLSPLDHFFRVQSRVTTSKMVRLLIPEGISTTEIIPYMHQTYTTTGEGQHPCVPKPPLPRRSPLAHNLVIAHRLIAGIIFHYQGHGRLRDLGQPSALHLQKFYCYTTRTAIGFIALTAAGEWAGHSTRKCLIEQTGQTLKPFQWYENTSEPTADDGILAGAAVLAPAIYIHRRAV